MTLPQVNARGTTTACCHDFTAERHKRLRFANYTKLPRAVGSSSNSGSILEEVLEGIVGMWRHPQRHTRRESTQPIQVQYREYACTFGTLHISIATVIMEQCRHSHIPNTAMGPSCNGTVLHGYRAAGEAQCKIHATFKCHSYRHNIVRGSCCARASHMRRG